MARFMSKGSEHGECGVIITRWGTDVNNSDTVRNLRRSPNNGVFFFEVESAAQIRRKTVDFAKQVLAMETPPMEVEMVSGISDAEMEAEIAAAEENSRIKREQEEAEAAEKAARKEEHDRITAEIAEVKRRRKAGL